MGCRRETTVPWILAVTNCQDVLRNLSFHNPGALPERKLSRAVLPSLGAR